MKITPVQGCGFVRVAALLFGLATLPIASAADAQCRVDADCKLIYSSCGCEAVPTSDLRDALDNDHGIDCHHNVCRSDHARAVCLANACVRKPQAPIVPDDLRHAAGRLSGPG